MKLTSHLKDVFEFAKKMEIDGRKLYETELKKTDDPGLKSILRMLIEAEKNHYEIFDAMQNQKSEPVIKTSLAKVKNVFQKMSKQPGLIVKDHSEFYKKIQKIEEDTEAFYRKEAAATTEPEAKQALLQIADEEHRHVILVATLTEFVSHPQTWIENAEFNKLKDY